MKIKQREPQHPAADDLSSATESFICQESGIEGIDLRPTISSLFLPSVKQVPRGDGLCLQKEWINGSCKEMGGGGVGGGLGTAWIGALVEWKWLQQKTEDASSLLVGLRAEK